MDQTVAADKLVGRDAACMTPVLVTALASLCGARRTVRHRPSPSRETRTD